MLVKNGFNNIVLESCGANTKNSVQMLDAGSDIIVSGKDLLMAHFISDRVDEYRQLAGIRKKSSALELAESWKHAKS